MCVHNVKEKAKEREGGRKREAERNRKRSVVSRDAAYGGGALGACFCACVRVCVTYDNLPPGFGPAPPECDAYADPAESLAPLFPRRSRSCRASIRKVGQVEGGAAGGRRRRRGGGEGGERGEGGTSNWRRWTRRRRNDDDHEEEKEETEVVVAREIEAHSDNSRIIGCGRCPRHATVVPWCSNEADR